MKKHNISFFGKNYEISTFTLVMLMVTMFVTFAISCVGMAIVSGWLVVVWFIVSFEFSKTYEDGTVKDYAIIKNKFARYFIDYVFLCFGMFMFFHHYINV